MAMPFDSSCKFISCNSLTPLPLADGRVLGLAYHEGIIVTILDTAKIMNLPKSKNSDKICLLFAFKDDWYGLIISEGKGVFQIKKDIKKYNIFTPSDILAKLDIYDQQ